MLHRLPFRAMGGEMLAILEGDVDSLSSILDKVSSWFEGWEQTLSRFRSDSELSRLNQTFDQPVEVSDTLWDVFQYALSAETITNGLVTPTVLDAMLEAGYDQGFDNLPRHQYRNDFPVLTPANPLSLIIWDEKAQTICLPQGVRLDLGGVAKGWAAHQTVERLKAYGSLLMNAAGDIAISDSLASGEPWQIGVRNPFVKDSDFETLNLKRCGVATSGRDRRHWSQNGLARHHIINPYTGLPAETNVIAVTIVAPTVMEAEAAAKAALILGGEEGLQWIESDPALAGIIILENGHTLYSQRIGEYL
ncbi:MAG: FAD:protein FMN transferase [Anaerolineales bacterium]|nr:FAD:protein FMN transferase [Anaerolineales bacterium]